MKLTIPGILENPELRRAVFALQTVFSNVSLDNMNAEVVVGDTDGSADTARSFRHNLGQIPELWFALEGDVYVPRFGVTEEFIDIRSAKTDESFRLILIK